MVVGYCQSIGEVKFDSRIRITDICAIFSQIDRELDRLIDGQFYRMFVVWIEGWIGESIDVCIDRQMDR